MPLEPSKGNYKSNSNFLANEG